MRVSVKGIPVDAVAYKTKTISDNGFNPVWDQTFVFDVCPATPSAPPRHPRPDTNTLGTLSGVTFLCAQVRVPDLALLMFEVRDQDPLGSDFIGQNVISMNNIRAGYRVVPLYAFPPSRPPALAGPFLSPTSSRCCFSQV